MASTQGRLLQLEVDAGNTRIKWRLRQQEAEHAWVTLARGAVMAPEKIPSVFLDLQDQFAELPLRDIDKVLVASVRGPGFKVAFSSFLFEKLHLSAEFAQVCTDSVGVRHCYEDDTRLGVDRWLAMLAAYDRCRQACVVVSCGTTVTVDLVDAAGTHMGGYIVPGLHMMRGALAARSRALHVPDLAWDSVTPGHNTAEAIHHGVLAMISGFLRDLHHCLPPGMVDPHWFVTGGDASLLVPHLDWEPALEADLVLDGMQLAPRWS